MNRSLYESNAQPNIEEWRRAYAEGDYEAMCEAYCHEGFAWDQPDSLGLVKGGICSFSVSCWDRPEIRRSGLRAVAAYILDQIERGHLGC